MQFMTQASIFNATGSFKLLVILAAALTLAACGSDDGGGDSTQDLPEIVEFESNLARVTVGTNARGEEVMGRATLTWRVEGGETVRLLADGEAVDLTSCTPLEGAASCAEGGTIEVTPTQDTIYTLDAEYDVTREVAVLVVAPATGSLETALTEVPPLSDVVVDYEVADATTWELGVVTVDEAGERVFTPCRVEGEADATTPCVLPEASDGEAATSGQITFESVTQGFTLALEAQGASSDRLGDIEMGDVELTVDVLGDPAIVRFEASDTTVVPGDTIELSWEAVAAERVEITADPTDAVVGDALAGCTDGGTGACEVTLSETAGGDVVFVAIARGLENATSAPSTQRVTVGTPPVIDALEVTPLELPRGGGVVSVSWETTRASDLVVMLEGADEPALDTAAGVGADGCDGACDAGADTLTGVAITENSTIIFRAINDFGATTETVSVAVEGGPRFTEVALDGESAIGVAALGAASDSGTLTWATADATSVALERAPYPEGGCAEVEAWTMAEGFGGQPQGTHAVDGLDAPTCLRLLAQAEEVAANAVTFAAVTRPGIDFFSSAQAVASGGDTIELSWDTRAAERVSLLVDPPEAASMSSLAACQGVNASGQGSCELMIEPSMLSGTVTFTLVAVSAIDAVVSEASTTSLQIGLPPVIDAFTASPSALDAAGDVTLTWLSAGGQHLEITDPSGTMVFTSDDPTQIDDGSTVIAGVDGTTTWTLHIDNTFGERMATTTAFFGPSIDALDVDGQSALDGSVTVFPGDVGLSWTTTNADSSDLATAALPASGDCADVAAGGWSDLMSGAGSDSATLDGVAADTCVRLTVENVGGQASALVFLVDEVPEVSALAPDVTSLTREDGGDVTLSATVTGGATLALTAQYLDADGALVDSRQVCDADSLESGALSDDTTPQDITCVHANQAYTCSVLFGCSANAGSAPEGAARIHYLLTVTDSEGDVTVFETDSAGDVTLQ